MADQIIDLEPGYTTKDVPGKCIKCLAEQKLDACLVEFLSSEGENSQCLERFKALRAFLLSPELEELRQESERSLADGKKVTVTINIKAGKTRYELKVT